MIEYEEIISIKEINKDDSKIDEIDEDTSSTKVYRKEEENGIETSNSNELCF